MEDLRRPGGTQTLATSNSKSTGRRRPELSPAALDLIRRLVYGNDSDDVASEAAARPREHAHDGRGGRSGSPGCRAVRREGRPSAVARATDRRSLRAVRHRARSLENTHRRRRSAPACRAADACFSVSPHSQGRHRVGRGRVDGQPHHCIWWTYPQGAESRRIRRAATARIRKGLQCQAKRTLSGASASS